jgi:hypothetical protein
MLSSIRIFLAPEPKKNENILFFLVEVLPGVVVGDFFHEDLKESD